MNEALTSTVFQGFGCANSTFPGVYSRISGAYDWIQEQICQYSENPPLTCGFGSRETGNSRRIRIDVTYNGLKPEDVSWMLLDDSGSIIGESDAGDVTVNAVYSTYFVLARGTYEFTSRRLSENGKHCC